MKTTLAFPTDVKDSILKAIKNSREVQYGWDSEKNAPKRILAPKLTNEMLEAFRLFNKFCKENFTHDLEDSGTCVIGQCIEIVVAEPRKKKGDTLQIVGQYWQGSTPNYTYHERVKAFVKEEIPQLFDLLKYNHGRMD